MSDLTLCRFGTEKPNSGISGAAPVFRFPEKHKVGSEPENQISQISGAGVHGCLGPKISGKRKQAFNKVRVSKNNLTAMDWSRSFRLENRIPNRNFRPIGISGQGYKPEQMSVSTEIARSGVTV